MQKCDGISYWSLPIYPHIMSIPKSELYSAIILMVTNEIAMGNS